MARILSKKYVQRSAAEKRARSLNKRDGSGWGVMQLDGAWRVVCFARRMEQSVQAGSLDDGVETIEP